MTTIAKYPLGGYVIDKQHNIVARVIGILMQPTKPKVIYTIKIGCVELKRKQTELSKYIY